MINIFLFFFAEGSALSVITLVGVGFDFFSKWGGYMVKD